MCEISQFSNLHLKPCVTFGECNPDEMCNDDICDNENMVQDDKNVSDESECDLKKWYEITKTFE